MIDVDDLEELGYLRVLEGTGNRRLFALTAAGRAMGKSLNEAVAFPVSSGGGRAPSALDTLRWLVAAAEAEPAILDLPSRILDRAVSSGAIEPAGREALARRIRELANQGYLTGTFPSVDQGPPEYGVVDAQDLALP